MKKEKGSTDELVILLLRVLRSVHSHLKKKHRLDLSKISPLKIQTLSFIKKQRNPLMKDVANFLSITPPSATSLIESMAKEELIVRHFDPKDRRVVHLGATAKGKKLLKDGFKEMTSHMKEIFSCLTEDERKKLILIYKKIYNFNK